MDAPITHHAKLTLARINVPMANYAPLVEMDSPVDQYESFDRQVGEALGGILGSDPKRWIEFLAAPKRNGGLGVHLPGVYHSNCAMHLTPSSRRAPVAERGDLTVSTDSYMSRVF